MKKILSAIKQELSTLFVAMTLVYAGLLSLVACSEQEITNDAANNHNHEKEQPIDIRLALAVSPATNTRNSRSWTYNSEAAEGENIQNAFVVMLNGRRIIEKVFELKNEEVEQNHNPATLVADVTTNKDVTTVTTGLKTFITFANMNREYIENLFANATGRTGFKFTPGVSLAAPTDSIAIHNLPIAAQADRFNTTPPSRTNGLPLTGIHNTVLTVKNHNNKTFTVYALRMVAKLQFDITNEMNQEVTVNQISVDRLTDDDATSSTGTMPQGCLKTFPYPATPMGAGFNVTVTPNLHTDRVQQSIHTYSIEKKLAVGDKTSYSFYVNETDVPSNNFNQFMLTLHLTLADGTTKQQRYAIINNQDGEWNYIARNDWRIIPITLQNYKLELVPQDFPPIGVLPAAVKDVDGQFVCTFYALGAFHLKPQLIRCEDGAVVQNWTKSNALFETLKPNTRIYKDQPQWSDTEGCIHGSFISNQTGSSTHTLTLTCQPHDGVAPRFVVPVIIMKK